MRLPESQIKQAILHPEEEVRLTATGYFADSYSQDTSVMSVVIEAVEKYGCESSFAILRRADSLPQSPASLDWLTSELEHHFDIADIHQDNYRFALAIILLEADPELLVRRHAQIMSLPSFPQDLRGPLNQRLRFHFMDWASLWTELERLGAETMGKGEISRNEIRQFQWLVQALAKHRSESGRVMNLLRRDYQEYSRPLMEWLEPEVVRLAGRMKLEAAIPVLMALLREGEDRTIDEIGPALGRIGGDRVVEAIENDWWDFDFDRKSVSMEALQHIRTDLSLRKCFEFSQEEGEFETVIDLCHVLLSHMATEAIEPVRQCVLSEDDDLEPDEWDIRWSLVATATIMGETFPEYEEWHRDAIASNYGQRPHKPARLADAFR